MRGCAAKLGALLLASTSAMAQQVSVVEPAALRCLGVTAGSAELPEFPPDEFRRGRQGNVQVLIEFGSPDRAPRVKVQEKTGSEAFVEAVLAHAKHLRVPCLTPDESPLRVVRDYQFRPYEQSVYFSGSTDHDFLAKQQALECVAHPFGPDDRPEYPRAARAQGVQGRVLARLRFDGPNVPPVVELSARPAARLLERAVADWVGGLRMPCHPGQGPITGIWTYEYMLDGTDRYGFKGLSFQQLLSATKGIRQQRLKLDTTLMACPFEVHFVYRRPRWRNIVGEVGPPNPARRSFLEWLEDVEFDLAPDLLDSIHGDSARVVIPCIRLNLIPKE